MKEAGQISQLTDIILRMALLPDEKFSYFLNSKKHILVVSFSGRAVKSDALLFTECQKEVLESKALSVIFNFSAVKDLANETFPVLSNMQLAIRDQEKIIYLCGIIPSLKSALLERAIVRPTELLPTLIEALQKIVNPEVKEK